MGNSCKEIAQSLVDCMQKTDCVKSGGGIRECMKVRTDANDAEGASPVTGECSDLRNAYFTCKRGSLDMRSRIRGQRVF